jgi:hypothetical protein
MSPNKRNIEDLFFILCCWFPYRIIIPQKIGFVKEKMHIFSFFSAIDFQHVTLFAEKWPRALASFCFQSLGEREQSIGSSCAKLCTDASVSRC